MHFHMAASSTFVTICMLILHIVMAPNAPVTPDAPSKWVYFAPKRPRRLTTWFSRCYTGYSRISTIGTFRDGI